jgi:linearmycin/streptolysin S transport system permease protein
MIRILDLTWKDLLQNVREKQTFVFLLLMPIIFTLMFGLAFGGTHGAGGDPRLPVGIMDQVRVSETDPLVGSLQASDVVRLVAKSGQSPAELEKKVADNKLAAGLVIPDGYAAGLMMNEPVKLIVYTDMSSTAGMTAQGAIQSAANREKISIFAAQVAQRALGADAQVLSDLLMKTMASWVTPPIELRISHPPNLTANSDNAYAQSSPGMIAQFAIAGLLSSAQIIVNERKTRCLKRLLTTAISRTQILLGHFLAIFLLILLQILVLVAFGQLFLKLDYLSQPGAILILAVSVALFVAGLGLLIGALAKTEDQAVIFALIPMFAFSALGGAWMPLEFTGKTFQTIGHVSPVAWVMDGFKNIIARGQGFNSVLLPAVALLGYAVLFFVLGVWRFRFDE